MIRDMIRHQDTNPSAPQGCLAHIVAAVSTFYMIGFVTYLALRLVLGDRFWWLALLNSFAIYTFFPAFVLLILTVLLRLWRYSVRIALICLLAVVWFGPFFQARQAPPPRGTVLTVATANLYDNEDTTQAENWLRELTPDLVFIQERPTAFEDGIDSLRDILPEQYTHTNGRLTLSRYPIVEATDARLVIEVDDRQIAVYNVHFPYPFQPQSNIPALTNVPILGFVTSYDETRRNQSIRELLDALNQESLPHIVGGDFNMSQHSLMYSEVRLALRDSFRETSHGLGMTWPANFPVIRIDYVWYGGAGLRAVESWIDMPIGSDHLPYVTLIELRPLQAIP
jgi:vancomycin resistance protein VanJ